MKIVAITGTFPPYKGGIGNAAWQEACGLAALGHAVEVLTPAYSRDTPPDPQGDPPGVRVTRLPPVLQFGNAAVCRGVLRRAMAAEAVYLHYPFFGAEELLWLRRLPARRPPSLVIRYHMDVVGAGWKRWAFGLHTRLMMPALLRSAHRVVFSTLDYAAHSDAAGYLRAHRGRCVEAPYGVDTNRFFPQPGVAKEPGRVLFVGGLDDTHYFKGLHNLLDAIAPLLSRDPRVRLDIVGRGNRLEEHRDRCRRDGFADRIHFHPSCTDEELRGLYTAAGVTVLPSIDKSEAFGLVLLESMACGTAIVASDLPGVRTLVQDGRNGLLAPPGPPTGGPGAVERLRECIARIAGSPETAATMGAEALRIVRERYSWRRAADAIAGSFAP